MQGLFAWISGSPFVLQNLEGLNAVCNFRSAMPASCAGFIAGGAIATRLVVRLGLDRTAGIGTAILMLAGAGMIAGTADWRLVAADPHCRDGEFISCGMAFVHSQVTAAGLTPFPEECRRRIGTDRICPAVQRSDHERGDCGNLLGATPWPMSIGVAVAGSGCAAVMGTDAAHTR